MTTSAARHPVEAAYPLSPLQRGLLFHSVSSTDLDAYVRQTRYVLKGPLEWDVLGDAWRVTAAAHPPLRTGIFWEGLEAPLQVVAREPALELDLVDLRDAAPGRSGQTLDGLALADRRRGFELSTPPLFRVTLARTAEAEHVLILTFHHILLDGWSMSMLLGDVFVAYAQLMQGVEPALAPRRPFKDYIGWLGRQPLEEAYGYWERRLAGLKELPLFARGGSATSGAADHVELASELDVRQTSAFSLATRRHRITGATLLYASWALALGSVLDVDDLVFGTLVSGRPEDLPGAEDMIGLFLNALPTRVEIDRDASVHSWLQALQQAAVRDRRFGHCSLSEIARRSSLSPGAPLVQSLVVYQNAPDILPPELDEFASYLSVEPLVETEMQGFPLVLACLPGERLRLVLSFDPEELDRATARALLERTAALMTRVAEASGDRLGDLLVAPAVAPPAGSEADRNSTVRLAPSLLEAPPDESPAILEGETRSTYGELRRRAAAVADELRAAGVTAEQSVLVSCARGLDLVAAMFGTWEAGAAYVPLDPGAPGSWRDEVVADCRPSAFVTDAHGAERAAAYGLPVIVVEEAVAAASREPVRIERAGAAAILYQRSATGPLGVVISHQSLAAAVPAWVSAYGLADAERHLMLGGPGDDAHLVEVLGAVGAGALIVVAPAGVERDPPALLDLVETERVGALQLPASVACDLAASGESSAGPLSHVRVTLVGGDDVTGSELERIRGLLHAGARVLRIWSRSETTVDSSVDAGDGRERPLPTSRLAVRDRSGLGVPELHMGTLTIGGTGVARGYLGRPGLTAARFVPDPSGPPGSRAFVTSERVRLLPGATIEHLEAPVQRHRRIRGMRFDLRELEAELEKHPGTALAGAMLREGKLHAFVVPSGDRLDLAALRRHLAGRLPAALVPDRLHEVAALPRMRDGCVDSARLAALDPDGEDLRADEPRTEVEWMLARAFADVLGLERVGLQDSFFAAGGDSLLALTLVGRVRAGGVGIELRDVLEWHTVAELARHCGPAAVGAGGPVAPPARQSVALSPSQRRFFADVPRDPAAMDMVEGLEFAERLEPAALEAAVAAAAARHPVLRSRFILDEGRWRCELARPDDPTAVPALDIADLAHLAPADAERAAEARIAELRSTDDLAAGCPWSVLLVQLPGASRLVVAVHHLVFDPFSWSVLFADLIRATLLGPAALDEEPTASFARWTEHLEALMHEHSDEAAGFWVRELATARADCPVDFARGENVLGARADLVVELSDGDTERFLRDPERARRGAGAEVRLAAALARAFGAWAGTSGLYLLLQSSGRDIAPSGLDLSRAIGWFTCLAPVWIEAPDEPPRATLERARERLSRVLPYKHTWDLLRTDGAATGPLRDLPEPPVVLDYVGQIDRPHEAALDRLAARPLFAPGQAVGRVEPTVRRLGLIAVEAGVAAGRLRARFHYSTNHHEERSVAELAARFRAELLEGLSVDC